MFECLDVIEELTAKGLLDEEEAKKLGLQDDSDNRTVLAGFIDGLLHSNQINEQMADRYVSQLNIDPEKLRELRENNSNIRHA